MPSRKSDPTRNRIWPFYALALAAVFVLRRRPGLVRVYSTWGYPWVPATFVIASMTIVVNRLFAEPVDSAAGLALVALGVPAYYAGRYATRRQAANAEPALARNVS